MSLARLRFFLVLSSFALWWGGLTFYSVVVVPIGTEAFDSTSQGFVTQQVTNWLNGLSVACLGVLLWNLWVQKSRLLTSSWLAMAVAAAALLVLHATLDRLMDTDTQSVDDEAGFYELHRIYLWLTALQWLAGVAHAWGLAVYNGSRADEPRAGTKGPAAHRLKRARAGGLTRPPVRNQNSS